MNSTATRDLSGLAALLTLVVVSLLGRFLPGPSTWGIHYHAYLPAVFTAVWALLAIALFLPASQRAIGGFLDGVGSRLLFSPVGSLVVAAVFGVLFVTLSEGSYFMGDGYLVGELVERGMPFRSFDNMDYLLHFQIYKSLRDPMNPGAVSSFEIYRWGSVLAGILGILIVVHLVNRLTWRPWQKVLVVGLFLFSGPAALFYGYVESYGFLLVFTSAFLLSGLLVLEGRLPLWVASVFFGLGAFMHLTAAFGVPALLFLALFAPVRPLPRRWAEASMPAAAIFGLSVLAHLLGGYDEDFFRREFLDAQNTKNLWVAMTGAHGFFSIEHWRDLLNLAFLSLPVPLAILVLRFRTVAAGAGSRSVQFLLVHAATVGVFVLFIDRKLGGARDWDLFAAHGFGLALLAIWALGQRAESGDATASAPSGGIASGDRPGKAGTSVPSPGGESAGRGGNAKVDGTRRGGDAKPKRTASGVPVLARAALPAAFLLAGPWIVLLHRESDSIARFTDVAAGFARFPRAYGYEELGKYYRKADDIDRAVRMYELCVDTYPANGRFHVLLGSMYIRKYAKATDEAEKTAYIEKAEASYREGARLQEQDPHAVTLSNLGKSLSMQGKWEEAAEAHGEASRLDPSDAENWVNLGNALLQSGRLGDAVNSYQNALQLDRSLRIRRQLGAALLATNRFDEAATAFREGLRQGEEPGVLRYGLAAALVAQADRDRDRGEVPSLEKMAEAETLLRQILEANPADSDAQAVYARLRVLMGSG